MEDRTLCGALCSTRWEKQDLGERWISGKARCPWASGCALSASVSSSPEWGSQLLGVCSRQSRERARHVGAQNLAGSLPSSQSSSSPVSTALAWAPRVHGGWQTQPLVLGSCRSEDHALGELKALAIKVTFLCPSRRGMGPCFSGGGPWPCSIHIPWDLVMQTQAHPRPPGSASTLNTIPEDLCTQ